MKATASKSYILPCVVSVCEAKNKWYFIRWMIKQVFNSHTCRWSICCEKKCLYGGGHYLWEGGATFLWGKVMKSQHLFRGKVTKTLGCFRGGSLKTLEAGGL